MAEEGAETARRAPVRVECRGAIRHLELDRPETRNPLDGEMVDALREAVEAAASDPGVRVILITGAGKAFSAGGNLGNIADRIAAKAEKGGRDPLALGNRRYGSLLQRLASVPQVTIVAAAGAAMGGGAGLVCAADISIGLSTASFGFPETRIGLVPAQILPFVAARLGVQTTRRLMLTAQRIRGDEAHRIGLLDHLVDDPDEWEARIDAIANDVLRSGPVAIRTTKRLLAGVPDVGTGLADGSLDRYLDEAADIFAHQMRSEALEGVAAMREKREPDWSRPRSMD